MFSMSAYFEWQPGWHGGMVNRNYFMLQQLLKDERVDKVLHIDFLPHRFRYFAKELLKAKPYRKDSETVQKGFLNKTNKITNKLYVHSTVRGVGKIKSLIKELDFNKNLIIWSYDPFVTKVFNKQKFPSKITIFDAVDNWASHPNYAGQAGKLRNNYKTIRDQADYVFTVSDGLRNLFDQKENVHWLPNGVDYEFWQKVDKELPKDLKKVPRPIIGYHGILQERLDQDLISYLANNNPDKSFVLLGWKWDRAAFDLLENYKNIYFLGHKIHDQLPKYVNHFDVAMIPHQIDEFTKSMNPLKLYEYLACGKPIISTKIAGLELFDKLIYQAPNRAEFDELLNKSLKEGSKDKVALRKKEAKKHDWQKRIDYIFEIIKNK